MRRLSIPFSPPARSCARPSRLTRWLVAAWLLTSTVGCQQDKAAKDPEIEPQKGSYSKAQPATSERPLRDLDPGSLRNMSELIAGLVPEAEEGVAPSRVWVEHARFMQEAWAKIDERNASMRRWAERELADMAAPEAPLLYPFGGPDLITAMQLFPEASSYLLVGLEAPGLLPMPEDFSADALEADLARLHRPFASFIESGYFVRSEIDKDLSGGHFDGILPILLICLVHAGQTPIALDYVTIDPDTVQIKPLPPDAGTAGAVRIKFLPREDAENLLAGEPSTSPPKAPRAVYYFAQDLSDTGLLSEVPFRRLVQQQPAINVYIKSGEYLAHTDDFATLRKLILAKAQTLLQDDSGLPIRFLRSDHWDVRLYGTYTGVLAAYSQWFQDDLAAAFAKPGVRDLEFAAGYNTTTDGGGLILALRRSGEPTDSRTSPNESVDDKAKASAPDHAGTGGETSGDGD